MSGALSQRIADVLAIPYNDASVKHSLGVLETKFGAVTGNTLLDTVEEEIQAQAGRVLAEMKPFYNGIKSISAKVDVYRRNFDNLSELVSQVDAQFSSVSREVERLDAEKRSTAAKISTLTAFMDSFTIGESELEVLKSQAQPIDAKFYSAFAKVKQIQQDCTILMGDSPRLAEELLLESQKALGFAYAKLRADLQHRLEETSESGPSKEFKHNLNLLSQDPFQLKEILSELSELRKRALKRDFVKAGHAHTASTDPERLVGEECAWLHSVVINEYDLFRTLLGTNDTEDFSFALFRSQTSEDLVYELIDQILQSVEPLFKQRIHRVIASQSKILVLDQIHNLLEFYGRILREHKQTTMATSFDEISATLTGQFRHLMLTEIEYAKQLTKVPSNLEAPQFIYSVLGLIRRLFENYQKSLSYQPLGDDYIRTRINDMLDPFIDQSYTLGASLDTYTKQIFSINCLDPIRLELTGHSFANFKVDEISTRIAGHQDNLVNLEYDLLLAESGLDRLKDQELFAQIDRFVVETLFVSGNRLSRISSPSIATAVTKRAYARLIEEYQQRAPSNAPKSAEDLRILLS